MDTSTVEPGFANLIPPEDFRDDTANHKYELLRVYLQDKLDRPERQAIRNLMGFIDLRLARYEEAVEMLNKVLEDDEDNVNALANLQLAYENSDNDHNDARHTQITEKLEELKLVLNGGDGPRERKIRARCVAEQGYAISLCLDKAYESATALYEEALELAQDLVPIEEKTDWKLGSARAKHGALKVNIRWNRDFANIDADRENTLKRLIEEFEMVLEHGDNSMKAETWKYIGSMFIWFARRSRYEKKEHGVVMYDAANPPECIRGNKELLQCYSQPKAAQICYDRALEYRPNYPQLLTAKATTITTQVYVDDKDTPPDYESALRLLNESIQADSSPINSCAFSIRGLTYFHMYLQARCGSGIRNDLHLLVDAVKDYEVSNSMQLVAEDFRQMGDIWRFMANDFKDGILRNIIEKDRHQCLEKASECYTRASEREVQLGTADPFTQHKHAECFLQLQKYIEASKCFKLAIEYSTNDRNHMMKMYAGLFFSHLMMLQHVQVAHGPNQQTNNDLVNEAAQCLADAIQEFGGEEFAPLIATKGLKHLAVKYGKRKDIWDLVHMFVNLCRDEGRADVASFIRKHSLPRKVYPDRSEMAREMAERESKKCNIIIYNLPEIGQNDAEIKRNDVKNVKILIADELKVRSAITRDVIRVGKKKPMHHHLAVHSLRPVQVRFQSEGMKKTVMHAAEGEDFSSEQFNAVTISPDLTRMQREYEIY